MLSQIAASWLLTVKGRDSDRFAEESVIGKQKNKM